MPFHLNLTHTYPELRSLKYGLNYLPLPHRKYFSLTLGTQYVSLFTFCLWIFTLKRLIHFSLLETSTFLGGLFLNVLSKMASWVLYLNLIDNEINIYSRTITSFSFPTICQIVLSVGSLLINYKLIFPLLPYFKLMM